jgi:large repetitive protein
LSTQDRGSLAAITLEGGEEIPNDATFYVTDQDGKLIPFELPVRLLAPRPRPVAAGTTENLEPCMGVRFDASKSSDPQGGALSYRWRFGDGNSATGPIVSHHYAVEGPTTAWLEVTNESSRVGNGATIPLPVFVKRPPVARSVVRAVVAIDEEVEFDGSSSSASFWNVVRHEWQISDGTVLTGRSQATSSVSRAPTGSGTASRTIPKIVATVPRKNSRFA